MGDVLVLGAGFSHAISSRMPLTDDLGQLVVDRLQQRGVPAPKRPFTGGYFEAWLARMAETQPDLDDVANAQNRASFLLISREIRRLVMERELEVVARRSGR